MLACLAALAAMKTRRICRDVWRSFTGRRGAFAALAAFAVIATICAQKPNPPVITVDSFLADAGSYATNDVLHVAVTNAPAYAGIDFSSCPVLVYARPRGLSDAPEWEELLPRRTFSELPADYAIEDATNYNYLVYLDYVPPSPVHTNGVFELRGFVVPDDEPGNLEQLAAGFINSRALLDVPYDSEVEYLESIGRQFIRTGVLFDALTDVIECEFAIVEARQYGTVFGANSRASGTELRFTFRQNGVTGTWQTQGCKFQSSVPYTAGGFYKIRVASQANGGSFINGTSGYLSAPEVYRFAGNGLYIFAVDDFSGQAAWFSAARLYGFKITRSGIPICDYIPVRKGSIGYLYDRASGQLFGNAGTGAFILGPDIKE